MTIKDVIRRFAFLLMLAVIPAAIARAASESYIQTLTGKLKKGDSCIVIDDKFLHLPLADWNQLHHLSVNNIVSFDLRFDTVLNYFTKPFTCTLNVSVKYFTSRDQQNPEEINNIDLVVKYDTAKGAFYPASANYKFKNAFKVIVVVNSITSPEWGEEIPAVFRLKNQILVERKYPFTPTISGGLQLSRAAETGVSGGMVAQRIGVGNADHQLAITWLNTDFQYAEEYDVEWTYIDKYSKIGRDIGTLYTVSGVIDIPDNIVASWMRNNSTRVTVPVTNYTINLPYSEGYILVRVRGAYYQVNPAMRVHTPWQYKKNDNKTAIEELDNLEAHEPGLNWQYTAAFAEEGKRKEVISYFDGSLRNRQSVTLSKDLTLAAGSTSDRQETAIVQESIYDMMGRQAMSILPAPVRSKSLRYYPAFNRNSVGEAYSHSDISFSYDPEGSSCFTVAGQLANTSGASQYYSPGNTFLGDAEFYFTKYVPDANKYPFSLTQFTQDNTGRIRRQGGVGPTFQIGQGRETQYFYGKPSQTELDRLFGSEVGAASHYLKNMVVDPNGQVSINYIDAKGKTIATALAGAAPPATTPLPSSNTSEARVTMNQQLIGKNDFTRDASALLMQSSATFLVAVGGAYQINYSINPAALTTEHGQGTFCSNCYYDVVVEVRDDCGQPVGERVVSTAFTLNDVTCHPNAQPVTGSLNLVLNKIGEYTVNYSLRLNEEVIKFQTDYYIENNSDLRKLNSFFLDELNQLNLAGCYTTCEECKTLGNTVDDFRNRVIQLLGTEKFAGINPADFNTWATNTWTDLKAKCALISCNATSACEDYLEQMKGDVRPGGQYATYVFNETTGQYSYLERNINVLQFYTQHILPYTDENGQTAYGNELTESAFIKAYLDHPEWADILVEHHIEYCSYLWCKDANNANRNEASYNFDKTLRLMVVTGEDAISRGFYNRQNMYALLNADPFFNGSGRGAGLKSAMQTDLTNCSNAVGFFIRTDDGIARPGKDIFRFIDWLLYCKPVNDATAGQFDDSWDNACTPVSACRSTTLEWELYRNYYLKLKSKYLRQVKESVVPGCRDCFIGKDVMLDQTDLSSCLNDTYNPPPCPTDGDFELVKVRTPDEDWSSPTESQTNFYSVTLRHLGGPLTRRVGITVHIEMNAYNNYNLSPVTITMEPGQESILVGADYDHFLENGDGMMGEEDFSYYRWILLPSAVSCPPLPPVPPKSTCSDDPNATAYAGKTRIFNEYVAENTYMNCLATPSGGEPIPTEEESLPLLKAQAITDLQLLKAAWKERLMAVKTEEAPLFSSISEATIDQLVAALYEISKKNIELATTRAGIRPASVLPAGQNASGYNNFQEAFNALIGTSLVTQGFSPYLLDKPYPYNKLPIELNPNVNEITSAICSNLTAFRTRFATSGFTNFHQYLKAELGDDYYLTEAQLNDLESRCTNSCRYLESPLLLPVAFASPAVTNTDHPYVTCSRISGLEQSFLTLFPNISAESRLYSLLYTNYMNHQLGYGLSFGEYALFKSKCADEPTAVLYNKPSNPALLPDYFACVADQIKMAYELAGQEYDRYITIERQKFRNSYISKCLSNSAGASVTGDVYEYHYTLYYYDQSGSLVKTVPPEGVRFLSMEEIEKVQEFREFDNTECTGAGIPASENKTAALQAFSSRLLDNTLKSMELWLYNGGNTTSRQVRFVSPDNRFFYQAAIHDHKIWVELYSLDPSLPGGISVTLNNSVVANLGNQTLQPWSHLLVQSSNFAQTAWDIYLDGEKLTSLPNGPGYPFAWDLEAGGIVPAEQLTDLKHLRFYNRLVTDEEAYKNYSNSCLSPIPALAVQTSPLLHWGRFNIPVPGSETTIGEESTVEYVNRFMVPLHGLPTNYVYNSLNKVVQQTSPDGGTSRFWYDRLSRLVISQNAEQLQSSTGDVSNRYSYTKYDELGRTAEVGEKINSNKTVTEEDARTETFLGGFYDAGTDRQVTQTLYDEAPAGAPGLLTNLRKRVAASIFKETGIGAIQQASYFDYDISGNVKTLYQYIAGLVTADATTGIKRIDYEYDLISGKTNLVKYQEGKGDQFYHKYLYDADNRVVETHTSRDKLIWNLEASYRYYLHGPLARVELGNDNSTTGKVQGVDYAYTLQGWLKGINGQKLDVNADMSEDGKPGGDFPLYARDVMAFSLGYFKNDYSAIGGGNVFGLQYNYPPSANTATGNELFNGNIAHTTLAISKLDNGAVKGYTYRYDQLNRLKQMRMHTIGSGATTWDNTSILNTYKEDIEYDANGNILGYTRHGDNASTPLMDQLTYHYNRDAAGQLLNNRLRHINDAVADGAYANDLDQQLSDNYGYDKIGNLIRDTKENLQSVQWTVYGKIATIVKTPAGSTTTIHYSYDAAGNRVSKDVQVVQGAGAPVVTKTFYVRDGQGNVMGVYQLGSDNKLWWQEQHLYGSSRLGIWKPGIEVTAGWQAPGGGAGTIVAGQRNYELANHLGNVLAVISDKKLPQPDGSFIAEVLTATDYYPFGMQMPGRTFAAEPGENSFYRYGFNGKENDNEVKGSGNQQDYGMRIYDSRVGRFLSVDPITKDYPWYTPYQFAGNRPIVAIDLEGLEPQEHPYQLKPVGKSHLGITNEGYNYEAYQVNSPTNGKTWITRVEQTYDLPNGLKGSIDVFLYYNNETGWQNWQRGDELSLGHRLRVEGAELIGKGTFATAATVALAFAAPSVASTAWDLWAGAHFVPEFIPYFQFLGGMSSVGLAGPLIAEPAPPTAAEAESILMQEVYSASAAASRSGKAPAGIVSGQVNGQGATATTGKPMEIIAPQLEPLFNQLGGVGAKSNGNTVGCCAEQQLANQLLLNNPNATPSQIQFSPVIRPRTNQVVPTCDNCKIIFPQLNNKTN